MKKRNLWLVLSVIVLAFGMMFVGCDNGDGNGGGTAFDGTWVGQQDGSEMKLVAKDGSFTVYMGDNPAFKGTYTVSGNNVDITFTQMYDDSGWTAYPENGEENLPPKTITGTISGNQFVVNLDDGSMTFTKQSGGSNNGGSNNGGSNNGGSNNGDSNNGSSQPPSSIFRLTRPLSDHVGKYAVLYAENNGNYIIGADEVTVNASGMSGKAVKITGGSVDLKMWVFHNDGRDDRYHGNDTVVAAIMIFNSANVSEGNEPIVQKYFTITFSDGAATKAWDDGQDERPDDGNNSGDGGDAFEGTWVGQVENDNMTLVAANNEFTVIMYNRDVYRGTYTVTGDALSLTFTFVNTGFMSNEEEDEWTNYDNLPDGTDDLPPKDITAIIDGNEFYIADLEMTFTKQ